MSERLVRAVESADTVVFDFDGVLADSEQVHLQSYREVLAEMGHMLDETVFRGLIGRKEREIWPAVLPGAGDIDRLVRRRAERFLALAGGGRLQLDPRARRLLEAGGAERVLLSSGNPAIVSRLLDQWDIAGRFNEVHALGNSADGKPDRLRRLSAVRAGTNGWRGVLVEDSPHMLDVGRSLGMLTVGVVHSLNRREDLSAADFVVERTP